MISNQISIMYVLHTSFYEAGKVHQRIDLPSIPMSRIIKVDKSEPIDSLARTTGHLKWSCDGRLPYMPLIPCFLTTFSCMKRKDITRKGGGVFCGSRMLTGSGLKLAFAHRCSRRPDHTQTNSREHEGNESQQ